MQFIIVSFAQIKPKGRCQWTGWALSRCLRKRWKSGRSPKPAGSRGWRLGDVVLTTLEVADHGDLATEVGSLTATVPGEDGNKVSIAGKFIVLWKRGDDGTWRFHRDIWNFDA